MPVPNFQQQSMQAMQQGQQLGSALRNAQALQEQRAFNEQLRPMQLQQQQLQNESMQQQNLQKELAQDAILLTTLSEEDGKKVIPELINKYEGNESVIAGFNNLYKSTGRDYIKNNLRAVAAFTGKMPGQEKERALSEPEKNLETLTRLQSELDQAMQTGDADLIAGKKNNLENFQRLTNKFGATTQEKSDIKVAEEEAKVGAKGRATRLQGYIDSGIDAADSVSNLKRTIDLMAQVETGGFDNVALKAKRLFGVESANEAELSANMGKSILAQLKPIFGAAFTAAEGERLEKIEANFGKSTEGNVRLLKSALKIADRAARRGLRAAENAGDDFTAEEIKNAMIYEQEKVDSNVVNWADM